jgi:hypothetical protein
MIGFIDISIAQWIAQHSGHLLILLFSLGRDKGSESAATFFGILFWLIVFLIGLALIVR